MSDPSWDRVQKIDTKDWDRQPTKKAASSRQNWDREIAEIEAFFPDAKIPDHPIMYDDTLLVGDVPKFVRIEMEVVYANRGVPTYRPYLTRVVTVMRFLQDLAKMEEMAYA